MSLSYIDLDLTIKGGVGFRQMGGNGEGNMVKAKGTK